MTNKLSRQRQDQEDLRWNRTMLFCAALGFSILLLASLLQTYYLGSARSELTAARVFYTYFMANHHQLTKTANSLLVADFTLTGNFPKDVSLKDRENKAKVVKASLADHIKKCRYVLGQDKAEQIIRKAPVLSTGEALGKL